LLGDRRALAHRKTLAPSPSALPPHTLVPLVMLSPTMKFGCAFLWFFSIVVSLYFVNIFHYKNQQLVVSRMCCFLDFFEYNRVWTLFAAIEFRICNGIGLLKATHILRNIFNNNMFLLWRWFRGILVFLCVHLRALLRLPEPSSSGSFRSANRSAPVGSPHHAWASG